MPAISRSMGVSTSRTSKNSTMTSACSIATRVWASIAAREASLAVSRSSPAVSTTVNSRPRHSATPYRRSRVRPDSGSTIALRQPRLRLKRGDFPTLGRPTMATIGRGMQSIRPDRCFTPLNDLQRLGPERTAVGSRDEGVGVHGDTAFDSHDDVHIARPRALRVKAGGLRGMVGMAVVVADDVEARVIGLALNADVVPRVYLVTIARALDDDVV